MKMVCFGVIPSGLLLSASEYAFPVIPFACILGNHGNHLLKTAGYFLCIAGEFVIDGLSWF